MLSNKPLINNNLRNICTKSTNETIRKLTEKYNLEKKKPQFKTLIYDNDDGDGDGDEFPKFYFLNLLLFLSISYVTISSVTFYFYKRLK